MIYGVVRGAIANPNRLARQCEVGEVPIASELGDAAFLWQKAHESTLQEIDMGSMKGKQTKIDAAFGRLADMIQSGHLLAGTDPVGFLDTIATELKDLRAENVKLRDRISELELCIRQMCNNALDLGYCDMRDCHDCKTFKVCGVEE